MILLAGGKVHPCTGRSTEDVSQATQASLSASIRCAVIWQACNCVNYTSLTHAKSVGCIGRLWSACLCVATMQFPFDPPSGGWDPVSPLVLHTPITNKGAAKRAITQIKYGLNQTHEHN